MRPIEHKRLCIGLTQAQFADRLGVHATTVGKWESGITRPSPEMYPRLAEVLNIPAEEVVRLFAPEPESVASV